MTSPFRRSPLALAILGILAAGPLHPYGIQRRIKEWGKDHVVNVEQRSQLYKTISRLETAGLVKAERTDRDPSYPERTTYRITKDGQRTAAEWLADMIRTPRNEYPEFLAALSFAPLLTPDVLRDLLSQRREALMQQAAALKSELSASVGTHPLPRVVLLDAELRHATIRAEIAWTSNVLTALADGSLRWTTDELIAYADAAGFSEKDQL